VTGVTFAQPIAETFRDIASNGKKAFTMTLTTLTLSSLAVASDGSSLSRPSAGEGRY